MMKVICCYEDAHCGKTPCIADIDDDINIEKFNECFYSTVKTKWKKTNSDAVKTLECLRCEKEKGKLPSLSDFKKMLNDEGIGQLFGNAPFIYKYLTTPIKEDK